MARLIYSAIAPANEFAPGAGAMPAASEPPAPASAAASLPEASSRQTQAVRLEVAGGAGEFAL